MLRINPLLARNTLSASFRNQRTRKETMTQLAEPQTDLLRPASEDHPEWYWMVCLGSGDRFIDRG